VDDPLADLSAARIASGLLKTRFRHVEVHSSLASTQTLLVAEGGRDGRVVVADHQTAGKGRAGRSWLDVPGRMLMFSALLREIGGDRIPLVSLVSGVAVARGIEAVSDVKTSLKWPNDVLIDGRKVCGIIGELSPSGDYLVVGIGVNVAHEVDELQEELNATSLKMESPAQLRRDDLCVAVLSELDSLLVRGQWMDEYRRRCSTIGARVRAELSDESIEGTAQEVRDDGALVVDGNAVLAGDVVHLR
jgi:BirA family transcriptional regulator, biotin operon repressor / biotin---[acetyl-CoA-carboxylase] ligase